VKTFVRFICDAWRRVKLGADLFRIGLQHAALTVGTALATLLITVAVWPLARTNLVFGVAITVGVATTLWVLWSNLSAFHRSRAELPSLTVW
jgi:ABC-type transport system involved in cytochrome c biogenesis permease component